MPEHPAAGMVFAGTGAQILVECLIRAGIELIFGLPGDTGITFYDALYRRREAIRHILVRDERHGAVMADAYARCTNRVGVVEASSGGGVTYLLSGLGEPFAASVPLLAITSDIRNSSRGSGAITEIDQLKLFAAVTKWSAMVTSAGELPHLVAEALAAATSGRPAPVSLVVPEDVLDERATVEMPPLQAMVPAERLPADHTAIRVASELLRTAVRPAMLVGGGIHFSAGWAELQQLAEEAGIPVATTIQGKGAFPETNPWSLGVAGANGARPYTNEYLAQADVVLLVGTRANATDTNAFRSPMRGKAKIIQIDMAAERAGCNFPGSLALVGDARTILEQLGDNLPPADKARNERILHWIAERRVAWATDEAQPRTMTTPSLLDPREIVRAISTIAGPQAIVVAEPGTPTPNIAAYWEVTPAGRRVIIPRGHGAMGYVIPGAIGAALANPGVPVIGLTADGSFAMACGELETACRLNLPIVYVQFTNGSFGWIKMLQHLYSDQHYFSVEPGPIDTVLVARGMGLVAERAGSLEHFRELFSTMLAAGRPAYIDVPVPDQIALPPPVAPWQATLAGKAGRTAY